MAKWSKRPHEPWGHKFGGDVKRAVAHGRQILLRKWIAEMPRRTLPRVGAPGARKAESWTAWARAHAWLEAILPGPYLELYATRVDVLGAGPRSLAGRARCDGV